MTENRDVRRAENEAKKVRRKGWKRVDGQCKESWTRAKYGPSMKPAKVTVRKLGTGEVVDVVDQSRVGRAGRRDRSLGEAARGAVRGRPR